MREIHRIFVYPKWANQLREELQAYTECLADQADLKIECIRSYKSFCKEARIKDILEQRGNQSGLVHGY